MEFPIDHNKPPPPWITANFDEKMALGTNGLLIRYAVLSAFKIIYGARPLMIVKVWLYNSPIVWSLKKRVKQDFLLPLLQSNCTKSKCTSSLTTQATKGWAMSIACTYSVLTWMSLAWDTTSSKIPWATVCLLIYPLSDGNLMTHFFTEWSNTSTPVINQIIAGSINTSTFRRILS